MEDPQLELKEENNRFKEALHRAYHKLTLYEGSDPNVWDAEMIIAKAVLNQGAV